MLLFVVVLHKPGFAHLQAREQAWTLAECQAEAVRQSRDLRAAGARLQAAQAMARQNARWTNPEVAVNLLSDEREMSVTQEFDIWGKRPAAARAAHAAAETLSMNRAVLERELRREVIRHYWNLAAAQRLASLHAEEQEAWRRLLAIREQEVTLGAFAHVDMLLLRETATQRDQRLRQTRYEGDVSRAALNLLLNRPPVADLRIAASESPSANFDREEFLSAALQADPAIHEAHARVAAAGYRIQQERRAWRPNPHFGPSVKEENGSLEGGVQLSFTLPVLDGNRDGIQAAHHGVARAAAEVEAAELRAIGNAYQLFLDHQRVSEALAHYENAILPPAETRFAGVSRAVETGDLSLREAVAARLEWLRLQQEVVALRHRKAETAALANLAVSSPAHGVKKP